MGWKNDAMFCLLMALVFNLAGCGHLAYPSGPYTGQVVDAETNQPIAGAAVIAIWMRETSVGMVAEGDWDCFETLSDANGEFAIPHRTHFTLLGRILDPDFVAYFPGYAASHGVDQQNWQPNDQIRRHSPVLMPMKRLATREERVLKAGRPVGTLTLPWEKVPNLMRLINEELRQLGLQPYSRPGSQP